MKSPRNDDAADDRAGDAASSGNTEDSARPTHRSTSEPFAIVIHGAGKRTLWGRYPSWQAANEIGRRLRAHSIDARVIDERGEAR